MHADRDAYMNQLKAERKNMYLEKLRKFNEALEQERKIRLAQRVVERREERRQKWLDERAAEKKRQQEEIRRVKEEQQKAEQEIRKKEREAELEKLRVQGEKQRQREEEAERKIEEERERNRQRDRDSREMRGDRRDRDNESGGGWRNVTGKDTPAKEGAWRSTGDRSSVTPSAARGVAVAPAADEAKAWRRGADDEQGANSSFRGGYKKGGDRREDRRDERREDRPIRRGGDDRGERDIPMRRSGEDAPIRRGGDDAPIRRGGDDRENKSFRRESKRDDRGGARRGDGPIRRSGFEDSTNWRARGEDTPRDEASSWRRAGDKN